MGNNTVEKIKNVDMKKYQFSTEDVLKQAVKIPLVKVERDLFLKKELAKYYSEEVVRNAIDNNPAYAGI